MKILFLAAANSIHTIKWVDALAARGHDVLLAFNKGHEPKVDHIDSRVKLHCLKYPGMAGYYLNAFELRKVFKDFKPDIVNAHYASGYGTLARVARLSPEVLSVWGSDVYIFPYESKMKKKILQRNVRYADLIASTSNCMAEQLKKVMPEDKLDITITPFGVDLQRFNPDKYSVEHNEDRLIIGNIKALESVYGIKELIFAFARLLEKHDRFQKVNKKVELFIYGEGSEKQEILELIKELELEDFVKLKGKIPNTKVPEALAEIDIFCALSVKESFGVAAVEAMAMEKPVVVSDAEGFREVVENGITGFIVGQKDTDSVVRCLEMLIGDPDLRKQMGQSGRKRVINLYDWEKNVVSMLQLYNRIKCRGEE